ncbi:hypothetical protein [Bifidobacterium sp. SO1]|uniref:hypothetical protein n=1 Tax=Bifidobacterium sp. SO1 TaxID=2809029 RepID=UPI001BDC8488|nr:hypothetical protein [Bifidobacterium sp. SO1]MBT1162768.1 hypothetical protein [Bifidobacterium sp. SO1]
MTSVKNDEHPESFISPASEYGLLRAATPDRTVWLYARIPWSAALLDGANDKKREEAANQFASFFDGLAGQVSVAGMRYRYLLQSEYREFHLLTGSMPVNYMPPAGEGDAELRQYQARYYRTLKVRKQFAVIGVPLKLIGETGRQGRKKPLLQRFTTGFDRLCYSIANGCPTFEEYLPDAHVIEQIMLKAGLEPFTLMEDQEREKLVAMMESWWVSRANASALPIIAENDHVHFFPDSKVCQEAKKKYDDGIDCADWGIREEYPATLCFARTSEFNRDKISDPSNLWVARLMEVGNAGGANAIATSIRGKVEPAKITADTIRRNYRTIRDSINERYDKGREASGDMTELEGRLEYKRSLYNSPDMPPTLIDLSIATCVAGNAQMAIDSLSAIPNIEFTNLTTANEQLLAFKSMQACSPIRMTPYEIHWSATCVSGSGVSSMARGGDNWGALLGLSEANRQPLYIGTTTVQDKDMRPIFAIIGDTGSGKHLALTTPTPMPPQPNYPNGSIIPFGQVQEGDYLYGRDGKPYQVKQLHPIVSKDTYLVTLSDGQSIIAGGDHLWTVSSFKDRNVPRKTKHRQSVERYETIAKLGVTLRKEGERYPEDQTMTAKELAHIIKPILGEWMGDSRPESWVTSALQMMSFPSKKEAREIQTKESGEAYSHTQNRRRYDPKQALTTLIEHYDHVAKYGPRWQEQARQRTQILHSHLDDDFQQGLSVGDIRKMLGEKAPSEFSINAIIAKLTPVSFWDKNIRKMPTRTGQRRVTVYNVKDALNAISLRLLQRYGEEKPNTDYMEQVVSTKEMLAAGLVEKQGGQAKWAIHVPTPVENPEMRLAIDPYLLGAWLADGSKGAPTLTSDATKGDLDYLADRFLAKGFPVTLQSDGKSLYVRNFEGKLRYAGLLKNKHIPEKYFFASVEQRLELVRGLLDQDGAIDAKGNIEFSQSIEHENIIRGMVRLLRSLGIVVHEPKRAITTYTRNGERHQAQDRLRLQFTTNLPVFSLERKRMLLPKTLRETQQWLYIKDIQKIEDNPCRCITVGSPDHTYLVGDYIPTHNTMAAFSLFLQWSKIMSRNGSGKTPCIYINPKSGDDLEDATESQHGVVIRLDQDIANGTFDPLLVMENIEEAKEMAAIMLSDILNPKGEDTNMELAIAAMLDYGIQHGARCCGLAISTAAQAYVRMQQAGKNPANIGLPDNTVEVYRHVRLALSHYQSMRLILGTSNETQSLRISQNLTLINAGTRSLVPEPNSEQTVPGRIQQWVLRMVVLGAGAAVRGRDGMVGLDEAWVAMGKGKGASKTLEQWVRMARSQRFTPVLASQKVQEFIDAGLTGGISRALLLALDNPDETNGTVSPAKSALRLLNISDPSGHMLYRMGLGDTKDNNEPQPMSLKRLKRKNPITGKEETVRGAVAYFKDGSKQPVPVEIIIPPDLLKEISTTATDKIAREKRKEQADGVQ